MTALCNSLIYISFLSRIVTGDVMRSIMYVAIFVLCMFLISGMLKNQAANSGVKQIAEQFLNYFKNGDFESLYSNYPAFIQFENSFAVSARQRLEDITLQQKAAFDDALQKFNLKALDKIKIEKVIRKPFQYDQRTDSSVTGQLIFKDGSLKDFRAVLLHQKIHSLMIDGDCVLNNRCAEH